MRNTQAKRYANYIKRNVYKKCGIKGNITFSPIFGYTFSLELKDSTKIITKNEYDLYLVIVEKNSEYLVFDDFENSKFALEVIIKYIGRTLCNQL